MWAGPQTVETQAQLEIANIILLEWTQFPSTQSDSLA